jgi:CheY-like chemotaxis protein
VDLVVLDLVMPGMDGRATFQALRELDPGVKVLLSSGYSAEGQGNELQDLGAVGFVQKPFSLRKLSHVIGEVLEG